MTVPDDLSYTSTHEWIRSGDGAVRVGITDYAQDALGDVVYVTLPEPGTVVQAGQAMGEVESTKTVSDLYAPTSGTVRARNDALAEHPEQVNADPYGQGWLVEIEPSDAARPGEFLDAGAYRSLIEGH
jgi:glycine cleavage system H protein